MMSRAGEHEPKRCQPERPWDSAGGGGVGGINWLSLAELAFSFLFPFCPHYLLLTFLWLVLCFSSAWLHSTGALAPPAGGGRGRLPDAQAVQDREGEEAGGCDQGTAGRSSTYLLSCRFYLLFVRLCSLFWTCRTCSSSWTPSSSQTLYGRR